MTTSAGPIAPHRRDIHPPTRSTRDLAHGYSFGVLVGRQLWISGQVAVDASGDIVGDDDIEAQTIAAFENMKTVVEEAGGRLDDVVKITTYIADPAFLAPVQAVRRRYFPGPRHPASTTIVAGMIRSGLLVMIDAVAVLGACDAPAAATSS